MYEVRKGMPAHARVVIPEPREGWTRSFYDRHIDQYTNDRGAPPRTVTLHPETMETLGFSATWVNASESEISDGPILVSSPHYARDSITLYE